MEKDQKDLEDILIKVGVDSCWWKKGNSFIGLDCSVSSGLKTAQMLLNYPDVQVEILTLIVEEDYLELGVSLGRD